VQKQAVLDHTEVSQTKKENPLQSRYQVLSALEIDVGTQKLQILHPKDLEINRIQDIPCEGPKCVLLQSDLTLCILVASFLSYRKLLLKIHTTRHRYALKI
jgi:hypothetical protein